MKAIWKFPLLTHRCDVAMPQDAWIIACQMQDRVPTLWAIVDDTREVKTRSFVIVGTGHELPPGELDYIGTVQDSPLVWHVLEITKAAVAPAGGGGLGALALCLLAAEAVVLVGLLG